jgi:hypothetical protein
VFINPDLLKTAAILVVNGKPDSTIFFARLPITFDTNKSTSWGYAYYGITTRHSVENKDVAIRFNLKGFNRNPLDLSITRRGTKDEPVNRTDWVVNRDTDLAILPIDFSLDDYDIEYVDHFDIVEGKNYLMGIDRGPDIKQLSHHFGVGDEIFSVGLFEHLSTEHEAQSVVRFGHIAFQPEDGEKILADVYPHPHDLIPIEGYLVEMTAWPGQSGSPVFLRPWPREERSVDGPLWERNFLIGMIQGFYPGEQNMKIDGRSAKVSPVNMNIGIVIPSRDIMDLLTRKDVVEDREKKLREKQQNPKIRPMRASKTIQEEQELTRSGFEDALRRGNRKIPDPDSEK